jgi:hypothetical protein
MPRKDNFETRSLELVCEIQTQLAAALNSLAGRKHRGLEDVFPVYCASHVNRAVEGYILLRRQFRLEASRLLIRPTIEATIKMLAVRNQPDLLYRIAYSEWLEEKKFIVSAAQTGGADYLSQHEAKWKEFRKAYCDHFPQHNLADKKLFLQDAAVAAGMEAYYDSAYRLYCQFTHAAFRATTGGLDGLRIHDNRTVGICTLAALEAVASLTGLGLHVESFRQALAELNINVED